MSMQFRSFNDLNAAIVRYLPALPRDFSLIVGIPRSGMLAANLLALHLNVPFTDLDGFLEGRIIQSGRRGLSTAARIPGKVLVLDDSVGHGTQMRAARERIFAAGLSREVQFAAVYVTPEGAPLVDFGFEELPWGNCFAWNVMHHPFLTSCCVDIDGVLCADPTSIEDDDGELYRRFLAEAKPLFLPTTEIGWLVTGRLEKYRDLTVEWLHRHRVLYRELVMLDMPDLKTKNAAGGAAAFKARVYQSTGATLFIESNYKEAARIAKAAGLSVLSMETQQMVYPDLIDRLPTLARRAPRSIVRVATSFVRDWYRRRRNLRQVKRQQRRAGIS